MGSRPRSTEHLFNIDLFDSVRLVGQAKARYTAEQLHTTTYSDLHQAVVGQLAEAGVASIRLPVLCNFHGDEANMDDTLKEFDRKTGPTNHFLTLRAIDLKLWRGEKEFDEVQEAICQNSTVGSVISRHPYLAAGSYEFGHQEAKDKGYVVQVEKENVLNSGILHIVATGDRLLTALPNPNPENVKSETVFIGPKSRSGPIYRHEIEGIISRANPQNEWIHKYYQCVVKDMASPKSETFLTAACDGKNPQNIYADPDMASFGKRHGQR